MDNKQSKIHMNYYRMVIQIIKQLSCWYFDVFNFFFGFQVFYFIFIVEKDKNKVLKFNVVYFPYFEISSALL